MGKYDEREREGKSDRESGRKQANRITLLAEIASRRDGKEVLIR